MNRIFIYLFIYLDFIYLFMRDTHRGTDTGRGRSRLHAGIPKWDSILGLQDQALGQGSAEPLGHRAAQTRLDDFKGLLALPFYALVTHLFLVS